MKKLFVILPLVLVLILSSMAVFAKTDVSVACPYVGEPLSFGDLDPQECDASCVPVWVAVLDNTCLPGGILGGEGQTKVAKIASFPFGKAPVATVNATLGSVATPLSIAQSVIANDARFAGYRIPDPQLSYVYEVTATDYAPLSWLKGEDDSFKAKWQEEAAKKIPEALKAVVEDKNLPALAGKAEQDVHTYWEANRDKEELTKVYKYEFNLAAAVQEKAEALIKGMTGEYTVKGVLVIVEPANYNVTITHHIIRDGKDTQMQATALWTRDDILRVSDIPTDWLLDGKGYFTDLKYDPAQTVINAVSDNKLLTMGQNFMAGYTVDLYYVAAQEGDQVDAAKAASNVAAAAQLPATGAADTLYVALSSLALVVLGVFLKK
ncbi:MAG: hypothetical protein PUK63_04690 [Clostridiales bacterium]|nr:hypothetical protein [Clostridiales bacterium]MDY3060898.1 hypothetical protein [Eubacteriales bacterium]